MPVHFWLPGHNSTDSKQLRYSLSGQRVDAHGDRDLRAVLRTTMKQQNNDYNKTAKEGENMEFNGVFHQAYDNYCYPLNEDELIINI